ncbi:MAG: TetR family transcriptional regulator [Actinomycetota bacterium]|nr:TetR family transcriptional regulator [Actinomycetota bacterium]
MTTTPRPPTLRERKKREARRRFQRTALALFEERGFEDVTVDDIAERADMSRSTFFRYFPTKEDVLVGRGDEQLDELRVALEARPADEPILRALRHAVQAMVAGYEDEVTDFVAMRRIARAHPPIIARGLEHQVEWEEGFAELLIERAGRPMDPFRARIVAGGVMAALRIAIDEWLDGEGRTDLAHLMDQAFDVLDEGLGAIGARPGDG